MKNKYINKHLALLVCGLFVQGFLNAQTITSYRYWFDNNIGSATTVSVTPALNENLSASLSTNALANGYHTITTQFKDANGAYSAPITNTFVKTGFNITAYDYWWDGNYSNHTTVNVTAAQTVDLSASIAAAVSDTGIHYFAIRFEDAQGNWSVPIQDTIDVTVLPTGIRELSSVSHISLSPNPTHAGSTLKFDGAGNEILTMMVTDVTGKAIQERELQNGFALQQYQVNTEELAAGVYFVKLSSGNGSATRKLVVQ